MMNKEDLVEEAKRRYPIGTSFICANPKGKRPKLVVGTDYAYKWYGSGLAGCGDGYLYDSGEWAEVITSDNYILI